MFRDRSSLQIVKGCDIEDAVLVDQNVLIPTITMRPLKTGEASSPEARVPGSVSFLDTSLS
jgi:hypothetical protein